MRILVVGATGTIGKAVAAALSHGNEIVPVGNRTTQIKVDLGDPAAIRAMWAAVGRVDAVVSAAGNVKFAPLVQLSDADFAFSVANKLMGQVNLVRYGFDNVADGGSFTLTSGILADAPTPGSGAASLVNGGLESFVKAAALEAPRGIRVNVISPPWVTETLIALRMDPAGGLPAAMVARAYLESVTGTKTGTVFTPAG